MHDRTPRRVTAITLMVVASVVLFTADRILQVAFYPVSHYSGWLLVAAVVLLACFGVRKKLSFLPVGSAANWLRAHVVIGLLSGLLYWLHTDGRLPTGVSDTLLAIAFAAAFLSGVAGLLLSRIIPHLLAGRGPDVIFEQIPLHLRGLRVEVEQIVLETDSPALLDLYSRDLQPFFQRPRNFTPHLLQLTRARADLIANLESKRRFLPQNDSEKLDSIIQRVTAKDNLDYHYAHQIVLKLWLFAHIPATVALLVFALLHIALVTTFAG